MSAKRTWFSFSGAAALGLAGTSALAQQQPSNEQADAPPSRAPLRDDIVVTPGSTSTSQIYVPPPGYPAPGVDINPGLPSSSRPVTDTSTAGDKFDLNQGSSGPAVVRGEKGGEGIVSRRALSVPRIHSVKRGDTLWDLCAQYYGNSYNWPKVWSYNPQIENPHWIYPGDQVRMRQGGGAGGGPSGVGGSSASFADGARNGFTDRRDFVPENTVFLRSHGFIGDAKRDIWGELVGSREDQMLLSDGNHVYLTMRPGVDVQPGQTLTIFRTVRQPERVPGARRPPGEIVAIKGSVRIDHWDPSSRIARGEIVESVDVIERGNKIGPVGRRLDIVPPRQNRVELWARVLTSIYPHVYLAQNQVVFIDRGSSDGLAPGNRLFVVTKGDPWRHSLKTTTHMARDKVLLDSPKSVEIEGTPLTGDERKFPEEKIAELRVLRTEKYSSIALVTSSTREIASGDRAVAKKGY